MDRVALAVHVICNFLFADYDLPQNVCFRSVYVPITDLNFCSSRDLQAFR
jgi:hypothetical protein